MLVLILAKRIVRMVERTKLRPVQVTYDELYRGLDRTDAERAFFVLRRNGVVHRSPSPYVHKRWNVDVGRLRKFIEEQEKSNVDE